MGGMPISRGSRFGGEGPRVGGVAASDTPDDPAVEGRVSEPSMGDGGSRFGVGFLRVGTPSGHVHCARYVRGGLAGEVAHGVHVPRAGRGCSADRWASSRRTGGGSQACSGGRLRNRTHLDLLATACEAARLAAGVLGSLALGGGVLLLLSHRVGASGDDVHVGGAGVHAGVVVRVRNIVMGGGGTGARMTVRHAWRTLLGRGTH